MAKPPVRCIYGRLFIGVLKESFRDLSVLIIQQTSNPAQATGGDNFV